MSPTSRHHPHPLTPQYFLTELASPGDFEVLVTQNDFEKAFQDLTPSVSQSEMEYYTKVQSSFFTH